MRRQLIFNNTGSLDDGLKARVADPLWLAYRQSTLAEFTAEDAGTPIRADVTYATAEVGANLPPGNGPLEARLEAEPLLVEVSKGFSLPFRIAAEAGRVALAWLQANDPGAISQLRTNNPLTIPQGLSGAEALRAQVWVSTSFNGARMVDDPIAPQGAKDAVTEFLNTNYFRGGDTWDTYRLAYRAPTPKNPGDVAIESEGGALDWTQLALSEPPAFVTHTVTLVPTRAQFPGMPDARWWSFEDANVSFGDPGLEPDRLAQFTVAEFAVVWGDDWFVVPLRVPRGSLVKVIGVSITDNFGVSRDVLAVPAAAESDASRFDAWRQATVSGGPSEWRLAMPARTDLLEGEPVEAVSFVKDEAANLGWAVEERVEGATGLPRSRAELPRQEDAPPAGQQSHDVRWVARTHVPDNWYPLVPQDVGTGTDDRLLGSLLKEPAQVAPTGRVLSEPFQFVVAAAEVDGGSFSVRRRWQRARTPDGDAVMWLGRERVPAPIGEGPGLAFDVAVNKPREEG